MTETTPEPYKIVVEVRMMDGTQRTFLVNRCKSVKKVWKALGKIWELDEDNAS